MEKVRVQVAWYWIVWGKGLFKMMSSIIQKDPSLTLNQVIFELFPFLSSLWNWGHSWGHRWLNASQSGQLLMLFLPVFNYYLLSLRYSILYAHSSKSMSYSVTIMIPSFVFLDVCLLQCYGYYRACSFDSRHEYLAVKKPTINWYPPKWVTQVPQFLHLPNKCLLFGTVDWR